MYFNSQSAEVIELSVLSCVPTPDFLNVWLEDETKPKLFHLKATTPPSQHPFTPKRFELHTFILGKHTENRSNQAFAVLL